MTHPRNPAVSVLLPVRNGEPYFAAALDSILSQEGVDFEVIVVDDGSSDGTPALLAACADPRLKVLRREGGGLVAALNAALAEACGTYVARMDADDIALPGRLALQAGVLDARPDVVMVHGSVDVIDQADRRIGEIVAHEGPAAERRAELLWERDGFPIIHPSVMMRRAVLVAAGGYRESPCAEDHELWLRLLGQGTFAAVPDKVLLYRQHPGGVTRQRAVEQGVSNLVNCICARWRDQSGEDLFDEKPVLYGNLREKVEQQAGQWLERVALARGVRVNLRTGHLWQALGQWGQLLRAGQPMLVRKAAIRRVYLDLQGDALDWLKAQRG